MLLLRYLQTQQSTIEPEIHVLRIDIELEAESLGDRTNTPLAHRKVRHLPVLWYTAPVDADLFLFLATTEQSRRRASGIVCPHLLFGVSWKPICELLRY
jgi:hypothetical protein